MNIRDSGRALPSGWGSCRSQSRAVCRCAQRTPPRPPPRTPPRLGTPPLAAPPRPRLDGGAAFDECIVTMGVPDSDCNYCNRVITVIICAIKKETHHRLLQRAVDRLELGGRHLVRLHHEAAGAHLQESHFKNLASHKNYISEPARSASWAGAARG